MQETRDKIIFRAVTLSSSSLSPTTAAATTINSKRRDKIGHWEKMFGLLRIYKERESHCNVPCRHKEDGKNLGWWLNTLRARKKKGKLDISLIERLEDIGVIWDLCKEKWKNNYLLLVKFQQREGHANVPSKHKEEGVQLGKWLETQRQQKKKGELDISLEERLEEVGVIWDIFKEQWDSRYRLLAKFHQREGHTNVPHRHREEGVNLGVWLSSQRYKNRKGKLDISLKKRLEDIGFIWNILKDQWENYYRLLVKFQQREGHANVPSRHREEGVNLGHWLDGQRRQKKEGELDASLEERLEEVGVRWNVHKDQWGDNYLLLVKYQQREGHANVPKKHKEEGVNLGSWLYTQHSRKKKRKLDTSREKLLDKIGTGTIWI